MNLTVVFKEVYGKDAIPQKQQLMMFSGALSLLPGFLGTTVCDHYVLGKTIEVIAEEQDRPPGVIRTWLSHGIHLLRIWCRVPG